MSNHEIPKGPKGGEAESAIRRWTPLTPRQPGGTDAQPSVVRERVPLSPRLRTGSKGPDSVVREWLTLGAPSSAGNPAITTPDCEALTQFRSQFDRAATFVRELDRNPEAAIRDPDIRTFVGQIAKSGFRGRALLSFQGASELSLPVWLRKGFVAQHKLSEPTPLDQTSMKQIETLFADLVRGITPRHDVLGNFYKLGVDCQRAPIARRFKCYLEGGDLLAAFKDDKVRPFFSELNRAGCGLSEIKLFENDRLVMYFNSDISQGVNVSRIAPSHSISLRGPAQDVEQVIVSNGKPKTEFANSNDGALGDGGHSPYTLTSGEYSSQRFLQDYLKLCLFAGKRPDRPYETSFVYLNRKGEPPHSDEAQLVTQAQSMVQYPVVAVERRELFVDEYCRTIL